MTIGAGASKHLTAIGRIRLQLNDGFPIFINFHPILWTGALKQNSGALPDPVIFALQQLIAL